MERAAEKTGVFSEAMFRRHGGGIYKPVHMKTVIKANIPKGSIVADLGSSSGKLVRWMRKWGYDAFGVDGVEGSEEITKGLVRCHDLTKDCRELFSSVDWATFLNVGEHVPESLEWPLIYNVSRIPNKGLIVAWADPKTPDKRVRNYQWDYYIANQFGACGWDVLSEATENARKVIGEYSRLNKRLLILKRR